MPRSAKPKEPSICVDEDVIDVDQDHEHDLPQKTRASKKRKRIRSIESESNDGSLGEPPVPIAEAVTNGNGIVDSADVSVIELEETDYRRKLRSRTPIVKPNTNVVEDLDYSSDERHRKSKRQKSITGTKKATTSASFDKKSKGALTTPKTKAKSKSSGKSPKPSSSVLTTTKSSNTKKVLSTPNSTPRQGVNKAKKNSTTPNITPKSGNKKNALNGVRTIDSYFAKKPVELSLSSDEEEEIEEEEVASDSSSDVEVIACKKSSRSKGSKPKSRKSAREIKKEKERLAEVERQKKLAFLYSGVPEVINKAKKLYEKKKEEEDKFESLGMFPLITHCASPAVNCEFPRKEASGIFKTLDDPAYFELPASKISFNVPTTKESLALSLVSLCCASTYEEIPTTLKKILPNPKLYTADNDDSEYLSLPWIEKYKVKRRKDLVVEKTALRKFEKWLRQWKKDIDDDGGSCRKVIEKKRRTDSDSDFVTDNSEDGELKKKSVILAGPSGTGKTAIVYTVAKNLGFKVVEVSFSERRSQKKVLQDVEEATLSRRLAETTTDDSRHCLLLFEDIDQIYEAEDEGFHSAVAQLISGSLRPIVMTISRYPAQIDLRIERKDPLWIPIGFPTSKDIVNKLLLPIVQKEVSSQGECIDIDDMDYVVELFESITRHSLLDLRKCINQAQALWSSTTFSMDSIHLGMQKLNLTLDYSVTNRDIHENTLTDESEDKKQQINTLEDTTKYLEILGTFDMHSIHTDSEIFSTIESIVTSNLTDKNQIDNLRHLTFDSDSTKTQFLESRGLYNEIQYQHVNSFEDYEDVGYFRTIIKNTLLNSQTVGTNGNGLGIGGSGRSRRSGRLQHYFTPVDQELVSKISTSLEFQKEFDIAKELNNGNVGKS